MTYWKVKRRRSQSEYKGIQVNLCNANPVKVASGQEDFYPRRTFGPAYEEEEERRQEAEWEHEVLYAKWSAFDERRILLQFQTSSEPTACAGCYRGWYNTRLVKVTGAWILHCCFLLAALCFKTMDLPVWENEKLLECVLEDCFIHFIDELLTFAHLDESRRKDVGKKVVNSAPFYRRSS